MDQSIITALQEYGFSDKEAKIYITCLELWSGLNSTIARRAEINRWTAYSILEDFKRKWIASITLKNKLKYFSVISPETLLQKEEERYEKIKSILPELLTITEKFSNRPKMQFFEWLEWLKKLFEEVLNTCKKTASPHLSFVGTGKIDTRLRAWLESDFKKMRQKMKVPTKVIQSRWKDADEYLDYHRENYSYIIIPEKIFKLSNKIIMYGKNKVAIIMYDTQEMAGITMESQTLYDGLTSIFNLIRDMHKRLTRKK